MSDVNLQEQLLRYAQDLHTLSEQHSKLQQRYQMLLLSQGSGSLGQDCLVDAFLQAADLWLVTNRQGEILQASAAVCKLHNIRNHKLEGLPLEQMMAPKRRPEIHQLLEKFSSLNEDTAIQCKLPLRDDRETINRRIVYDALVMIRTKYDQCKVYWLLEPEVDQKIPAIEVQSAFQFFQSAEDGLLITDGNGNIQAANPAFTGLTGKNESEVKGQHLRSIGSGLHGPAFKHEFWKDMENSRNWSAELFAQPKSGQLCLTWESAKAVINMTGKTISYVVTFVDAAAATSKEKSADSNAYFDALTGLPNRHQLEDLLKQAMTNSSHIKVDLCLLYLKMDHWKPLNDQAMQEVTSRLKSSVRSCDIIARIGHDEFVILLQNMDIHIYVEMIVERLMRALAPPIEIDLHHVLVEVSIGCARYQNADEDIGSLLQRAAIAAQKAKRLESHFCYYETSDANT